MKIIDLSSYPLERMQDHAWDYMDNGINWEEIRKKVTLQEPAYIDFSDAVKLFPHLKLDKSHVLLGYMTREFHGIHGKIVALQKNADPKPTIKKPPRGMESLGVRVEPPESAVSPLEMIYRDGTIQACLETILLANLLNAIPYRHFAYTHQVDCVSEAPRRYLEDWDVFLDIPDWHPRAVREEETTRLIAFEREYELGLEASDGRDRIYLREYVFRDRPPVESERLFAGHCLGKTLYVPKNPERYTEERRYSIYQKKSFLIAREKEHQRA